MKTTTHPFRLIAMCSLGLLLAGCDNKADSTKATAGPGRLFGVSFQTMNNPFFVDLNAGLQKTIEAHGDHLTTLDAQFNSLKQKNDISDLIQQQPAAIFINPVNWEGIKGSRLRRSERNIPVIIVTRR